MPLDITHRENTMIEAHGSQQPLQVGMLLYPGLTLLDMIGPQCALGLHGHTHLAWKTLDPVLSDSGISVLPTTTFAACPGDLDILFVPGGMGTNAILEDRATLDFLADRARTARFVTSVCSGSLILAAAGLLDGYRAATHWACYEHLEEMGVKPGHARVVVDGNRISGGGVTAGLDFGLTLLAQLRGESTAKITQLWMEYDPRPPFAAGTPSQAGPELTAMAFETMREVLDQGLQIARDVGRKRAA
jgi:cyclohexyl-isocyanide hydratase